MKTNRFKTLWGVALGLALLISAVPFAASAQTETKPAANAGPWSAIYPDGVPYKLTNGDVVYIPIGGGIPPGPSEEEIHQSRVWDETRKEHKIILEGTFKGSGTFIFESSTISYRHESGEYPIVTVNARYWGDKGWGLGIPTGTFKLPFYIGPEDFELEQTEGAKPVKVTKSKYRVEVYFEKPEVTEGEASRYSITITSSKQAKAKKKQETVPVAKTAATVPQSGPQSMPVFGFPSLDMNGMPKSGRPAFGNPFEEQIFDGPTDGMKHPAVPVTRMITPPDSVNASTAKIDVRGTVDKAAGFRFGKWSVTYLDATPDPDRTSDPAPVPFEGKPASGVSVLGRPWEDLSEPHSILAVIDPAKMIRIHFDAGDCDVQYFEHGEELDVIVTNNTAKPAEFAFTLWNAPEYIPSNTPPPTGGFGMGGYTPPSAKKTREYPAGTVSVEGNLDGRGRFVFEGDTIVYRHEKGKNPTGTRINGINWNDLTKPFELGFTPDYDSTVILEEEGRNRVLLMLKPDAFELLIDGDVAPSSDYYVKVRTKTDFQPKETAPKTKASAPARTKSPPPAPQKPLNPVFGPGREVVIKGTVDRDAGFRMEGNTLSYLNYLAEGRILYEISPGMTSYPMNRSIPLYSGDFASGVTVNGKPWTNLTRPFELNVSHGKSSAKIIRVEAGQCEIRYQHYRDLFEIALSNKTDKPVPFELTLWISDPAEPK